MNSEKESPNARLEEQLRFETFLANLSARFVNIPADELDREIEDAQRQIVEILGLDRSTLFQNVDNTEEVNLITTHCWARPGLERFPTLFLKQKIPWLTAQILSPTSATGGNGGFGAVILLGF
jgi:formate hydrogenlyase transcriptional activator